MKKNLLSFVMFVSAGGACAFGQSAWLPAANQLQVTPGYVYQSFDRFWMGKTPVSLKPNDLQQHTMFLGFDYGMTEFLALDFNTGYTWTHSKAFGGPMNDDGLADTTLGMRWRFLDEKKANCPWAPTLTLRAGGIVEGTYNENQPFSPGDGASGYEASLLFGKAFCSRFGAYGDIGYRNRNHQVPDDLFGSVGVYTAYKSFNASLGYRHVQSLSGLDIGATGFTPGGSPGFPQVREINQSVEVSLGYTCSHSVYYQVFFARTIDGRNTGEKNVVGLSITIPFGGRP